ncbi:UNVERIFIED_CONTAM: cysteinyl-tRNA synthetase [Mumia flava]|uniref:cysteine--tRNA ligase n=1 Tax=Mumia flava TaxID=1348852 RepID=UPI00057388BD|nr:cysteine--tRNA ligase [Mumia flava]
MTLSLYDSATMQVRDFVPIAPGAVGIYHCGLTVQGPPHLGHIRKEVVFDVLRRWMTHEGYAVTLVANVTDIDDKILAKQSEEDRPWWAVAYANERALHAAYDVLGCLPPTYEPRATGHIPEIVGLVETLIERGHAYVAPDGSGDVYFDVRSWPDYGELSRQRLDDMLDAGDADPRGKRDPRDFALWKGHKADEPGTAAWPSPWGPGRPGWHIECTAMATKYLGPAFDIHGGGLDLRFPHHENELAQARAAGLDFAASWMHNQLLRIGGEKMSKSVGNSLLVSEVVKRFRPIDVRYYLVAAHYRSVIDYSEAALAEAATAFGRIEAFVRRASEASGAPRDLADAEGAVSDAFATAMDDDLAVPAALAVVQDAIREGNKLLAAADVDTVALRTLVTSVRRMLDVLGLDPLSPTWAGADADSGAEREALGTLVDALLDQRAEARAARDFATADRVRDQLKAAGVEVEDTPSGPRWSVGAASGSED